MNSSINNICVDWRQFRISRLTFPTSSISAFSPLLLFPLPPSILRRRFGFRAMATTEMNPGTILRSVNNHFRGRSSKYMKPSYLGDSYDHVKRTLLEKGSSRSTCATISLPTQKSLPRGRASCPKSLFSLIQISLLSMSFTHGPFLI